ncbi:hypothetical protein SOVF_084410 [Spinacia oleracea]|uniref:Uncharacterized protein n=1 Tax=Spinacia oleracea TaxID=3562 RepID=A0A9R0JAJ9_SPIOL|nr:uncharacterized protein LOC110802311 [Spinacia oleracea]KNA16964.1 hypothetical protein SOVF_084410 [Spinacia oleracea]
MGLFSMTFAGGSLILIGAWESLSSSSSPPPPPNNHRRFSTITLISAASLSLLFIIDSLLSFFNATSSNDKVGSAVQLQVLAISSLFFMFSLLGSLNFPYPLLNLILLFAFLEEFLLFHLHLKDSDGIENRYYDLMLVPIAICAFSTMIELISPDSGTPKLGRGLGLILQGTWFVQMGFSFFTDLIANNCNLHIKSRGNYTINCKGHMDTHRGGAIAVLMFNCHLAFLVALFCGVFSVFGRRFVAQGDHLKYRPLGAELRRMENQGRFTLDSDSDDGVIDVVKQGDCSSGLRGENGAVELGVNGHGSHSEN